MFLQIQWLWVGIKQLRGKCKIKRSFKILLCPSARYQSLLCWKRLWESASSDLGHKIFPRNQDFIPMQMIRLLKIPGNWKDLLYISRNVYESAFNEGSPSGISRSFMGVLNICFHPLSRTKLSLYMHFWCSGAATQSALETEKGKGN